MSSEERTDTWYLIVYREEKHFIKCNFANIVLSAWKLCVYVSAGMKAVNGWDLDDHQYLTNCKRLELDRKYVRGKM